VSHPLRKSDFERVSYRDLQADQKADTRRRILDAAREVFLRTGFMEANLNEVASLAGVGKGTLYRHFAGKGELYVAMLIENGDEFADAIAAVIDPRRSVLEQLEELGCLYLDFWVGHPEYFQTFWALQNRDLIGPLSPELLEEVRVAFERPLRLLEALIRRGVVSGELRRVDPWDTANMLVFCATAICRPIVRGAEPVVERDNHAVYGQFLDVMRAGLSPAHPR
jgi:AcrR family transcriptional regulator